MLTTDGFGTMTAYADLAETELDENGDTDDEYNPDTEADTRNLAAELISWAVGVAPGAAEEGSPAGSSG